MTVEEHINYYAWIKGIPVKYRRQEVDKAIK
jgi:ATP-binding cassette subfamily A (ABC1) protein 3